MNRVPDGYLYIQLKHLAHRRQENNSEFSVRMPDIHCIYTYSRVAPEIEGTAYEEIPGMVKTAMSSKILCVDTGYGKTAFF